MVTIKYTEPGAARDLQRSFSSSLSIKAATTAPHRGLTRLFFQASTGPSQLEADYSSAHSSLLNSLISHIMESRTGWYSMKTNPICTLHVCMNYWLEDAAAKLQNQWIKQKFQYCCWKERIWSKRGNKWVHEEFRAGLWKLGRGLSNSRWENLAFHMPGTGV